MSCGLVTHNNSNNNNNTDNNNNNIVNINIQQQHDDSCNSFVGSSLTPSTTLCNHPWDPDMASNVGIALKIYGMVGLPPAPIFQEKKTLCVCCSTG